VSERRWLGAIVVVLAGCTQLGSPPAASLPADVHARPDACEVAEHPCQHGDVMGCIAKCRADDAQACNAAGVLFEFDDGERSDPALASGFYRSACDGNYGPGCNNLAWLYLRGHGVPHDPPHAMLLFMAAFDAAKLACTRGDASGCLLAGELLYEGRGVEPEEEQAVAFFRLACERGEARGCAARDSLSRAR
jgi:TPR repeat protein